MSQVVDAWDNVFAEPELPPCKEGKMADKCKKSYRLLDYDDVMKLSAVMETTVPIDGKGNFPSLEVTPSTLVQMVCTSLRKEGILVPSVRLNGSAATHVLSDDGKHPYKDLDLIFAVDLSEYDCCTCHHYSSEYNENNNNSNSYCKTKAYKHAGKKNPTCGTNGLLKPPISEPALGRTSTRNVQVGSITAEGHRASCNILVKDISKEDEEVDIEDKESGYTSSGSSVSSLPVSPSGSWTFQNPVRSRTHSLDSSSSVTSSSSVQPGVKCRDSQPDPQQCRPRSEHHELCACAYSKDSCWQKIKSVVLSILRDLLPDGVKSSRMTDAIVTDAYVQKMVKITNDVDRWSLISLNNLAGRNLELKFVEKMRRQYEFSVDSFQVILDSYQRFKVVSRGLEKEQAIDLSPHFFPSVLAESVYGDMEGALRHLRHRRICTKRPEEIRGGGLLRYCNLRVRDFTPGEVEGHDTEEDNFSDSDIDQVAVTSSLKRMTSFKDVQSYSTSQPEAVKKLEQLMCSRFFIDFSEFDRQQRKLQSYLDSHFRCEEDLKFQYLLIVGNVIERGNVCLMSHERTKILNYIRRQAVGVLSSNVNISPNHTSYPKTLTPSPEMQLDPAVTPYCHPQNVYPQVPYQHSTYVQQQNCHQAYLVSSNDPQSAYYYFPQQQYFPDHNFYPQQEGESCYSQQSNVPIAVCPCCQSTYVSQGPDYISAHTTANAQVATTAPQHTMSPTSPPFIPSSKCNAPDVKSSPIKVIYLGENDKLIYSAGPLETKNSVETCSSTICLQQS